ncbi:hypothetical protein AC249_AIPGENE18823 [Exaiptasia diaphana]|nr:hypothetical protein AC249_AIPGENE18823 [Exaiptasia diaphana]
MVVIIPSRIDYGNRTFSLSFKDNSQRVTVHVNSVVISEEQEEVQSNQIKYAAKATPKKLITAAFVTVISVDG